MDCVTQIYKKCTCNKLQCNNMQETNDRIKDLKETISKISYEQSGNIEE